MHGYSTDSNERRIVPLLLALLAIALAWVTSKSLATAHLAVPWWADAPSSTAFDGHAKRHELMIHIFQSWTQIAVYLTTATSVSRSCAAVIQVDDPEGASLIYQYQNQPLADAMKSMHMHYGTAMLRISNCGCLAGDYYAGRDRRTIGRICCKRVSVQAWPKV